MSLTGTHGALNGRKFAGDSATQIRGERRDAAFPRQEIAEEYYFANIG
jgi:hypothetical protein